MSEQQQWWAVYHNGKAQSAWPRELQAEVYSSTFETPCEIAPLAVQAWQPIETAPKDGTAVLLWGRSIMALGWWDALQGDYPWRMVETEGPIATMADVDGNDFASCNSWSDDGPTHWMPLPAPPTPEGSTR